MSKAIRVKNVRINKDVSATVSFKRLVSNKVVCRSKGFPTFKVDYAPSSNKYFVLDESNNQTLVIWARTPQKVFARAIKALWSV